jgi:hypothetical protein
VPKTSSPVHETRRTGGVTEAYHRLTARGIFTAQPPVPHSGRGPQPSPPFGGPPPSAFWQVMSPGYTNRFCFLFRHPSVRPPGREQPGPATDIHIRKNLESTLVTRKTARNSPTMDGSGPPSQTPHGFMPPRGRREPPPDVGTLTTEHCPDETAFRQPKLFGGDFFPENSQAPPPQMVFVLFFLFLSRNRAP